MKLVVAVPALDEGIVAGAVYRPAVLMVPAVAVQAVAPEEANCWVAPSLTVAAVGEMVCGGGGPALTNCAVNPGPQSVPGSST